jgi:hypothetical protein
MTDTIRGEDDKREILDTPEVLDAKITQLAQWFRESRYTIAFSGGKARCAEILAV